MQLSKTAYYGDFVIYGAIVLALAAHGCLQGHLSLSVHWLAEFAAGISLWTLLEYAMHRWVFHQAPLIAPMHDAHHRSPRALLGTPTWLSLPVMWLVIFVPAWYVSSFTTASGLIAGVMAGFLWYGILHHAAHHGRPRLIATRLSPCVRRHSRHHYSKRPVNFGVTTALWDHVFGTADQARKPTPEVPGVPS